MGKRLRRVNPWICLDLYEEGYTIRTIAVMMGCGRQTICNRLHVCGEEYKPTWIYGRNRASKS